VRLYKVLDLYQAPNLASESPAVAVCGDGTSMYHSPDMTLPDRPHTLEAQVIDSLELKRQVPLIMEIEAEDSRGPMLHLAENGVAVSLNRERIPALSPRPTCDKGRGEVAITPRKHAVELQPTNETQSRPQKHKQQPTNGTSTCTADPGGTAYALVRSTSPVHTVPRPRCGITVATQ
jgi:hypothetical protein